MNYEQFRTVWHEALAKAGLMSVPPQRPSEVIDLDLFYVSATFDWCWDALQAARSITREEDVLTELMGREAYDLDTVPPWLRIGLTLRGGLPLDSPISMPEPARWRRWAAEVTARLEAILPIESRMDNYGLIVLSSRSEPVAQLRCDANG